MFICLARSIIFSHWDQRDEEKVTWENSLAYFYLMGGQRARSQSLWWLQETIGLWPHSQSGKSLKQEKKQDSQWKGSKKRSDGGEGRAWERALGAVGKNRIEKPLSSVMAPQPSNYFSLRSRSSGLMRLPLWKKHIYGNTVSHFL